MFVDFGSLDAGKPQRVGALAINVSVSLRIGMQVDCTEIFRIHSLLGCAFGSEIALLSLRVGPTLDISKYRNHYLLRRAKQWFMGCW